jgi:hypothetical protein
MIRAECERFGDMATITIQVTFSAAREQFFLSDVVEDDGPHADLTLRRERGSDTPTSVRLTFGSSFPVDSPDGCIAAVQETRAALYELPDGTRWAPNIHAMLAAVRFGEQTRGR